MKEEDFSEIEVEIDPEVEKKLMKKLNVIMVLLTITILLTVGMVVKEVFLSKDNPEEKNKVSDNKTTPSETMKPIEENPEEKEIEVSQELAEKIYNTFYDKESCGEIFSKYYKYDRVTVNELTTEDKNYIVGINIPKGLGDTLFTETEIIQTKNKLFGEDTSFEIIDKDDCHYFTKLENGTYELGRYCGVGMCTPSEITDRIKAIRKGSKIYLEQRVIFEKYQNHDNDNGMTSYYYQDPSRTILLEKRDYLDTDEYLEKFNKIDWEKYEDQVSVYRYTYQDNGDNTYRFIQMEKVNN